MTKLFFRAAAAAVCLVGLFSLPTSAQTPRQNQQLVFGTQPIPAPIPNTRRPARQLNTLNDLFDALRACWRPPALENAHPGMQMTMRFSFKRDGKLLGTPQVTYATREVTPRTRDVYREAITRSLENCAPFPLTDGLGGAIAGRPFTVWIIDNRGKPDKPDMRV